jgi:hypothetical protein
MAKVKPLKFLELLYIIESTDEKSGETIIFKDEVEKKYKELCDFILNTRKSGEINIKITASLTDPERDNILVTADVSKKIQKIKNKIFLKQDESGNIYQESSGTSEGEEPEDDKKEGKK